MPLDDVMADEFGNDLEGSGYDIIEVIFWNSSGRSEKNQEKNSVRAESRTEQLLNICPEFYL
jgi:hypothetical protein